jgi:amino acid transporter
VIISWLLAIIGVGSDVAMFDIVSMAISGIYLSYLMVSVLLLIRRARGNISLYNDSDDDIINVPGAKLVWGPFHCPGILGTLVNAYAVIYISIIVFFSFWPSAMNPTVASMNWSVLAIGGSMFLAVLYYVVRARHHYTGPIMELSL